MKALVLDFDGVLFDSARESFAVACRTYRELQGISGHDLAEDEELYRAFLDRMPLGNGAADYGAIFDSRRILDREAGPSKHAHLTLLQERMELPFAEMVFVDDKVNHLDAVSPLGVRCVLAGWGYNGPREHELAASRGYAVAALDRLDPALPPLGGRPR